MPPSLGPISSLPISALAESSGVETIVFEFFSSPGFILAPSLPGSQPNPVAVASVGLTEEDLFDVWRSVTDPGYHRPILEKKDGGADAVGAMISIFTDVSSAVEVSTQSLYILPFSGQTAEPAQVERAATGQLEFSRVAQEGFPAWIPVLLEPEQFAVDHVGLEWSDNGPVEFLTGRRYNLAARAVLGPGHVGPILRDGRAEKSGASYNLPLPDSIRRPYQQGAGLNNVDAVSSAPDSGTNMLVLAPAPDLVSQAQVGQYLMLTAPPAVAGQVRRLTSYQPPIVGDGTGGAATLDTIGVFTFGTLVGSFMDGEQVTQASGATGRLLFIGPDQFAIEQVLGLPFAAGAITGSFSGATAVISGVTRACALPAATGVSWRVLSWDEVGLRVRNPEPFTGGLLPVLEELGAERAVYRASGEPGETYRKRIAAARDVVTPNALLRTANRVLAPYGGSACLREVGSTKLRGLFFDAPVDGDPNHAFAFDMDPVVRPGDAWKVLLDFTEMRAFFMMGVPQLGLGDFGVYGDDEFYFDLEGSYLDGYAVTDAALHAAVYAGLLSAKAGGVGFDLYVEAGSCT